MKISEIKELFYRALNAQESISDIPSRLEEAGLRLDFSSGFNDKVIGRIFSTSESVILEKEFFRSLSYVFYRIALPGVAAIVLLLISIFLVEGSLSFNSFLGLSESYEESIVCLLTGN
jgi:hypothetical protein